MGEIEAEALKPDPGARARLARRVLESVEDLSDSELDRAWAGEAAQRDAEASASPEVLRHAGDVLRHAGDVLRHAGDVLRDARSELR